MKHPGTPRRPHPDPEILALADSGEPDCGLQFRPGICTMKHAAAKRKEAEGKQHGPCAYCPLILKHLGRDVTKSADKETCTTCGNALTQNGFCFSCRSTEQRVKEAAKRPKCKTCGKCRVKEGFEYCSYCLKHAGRLKFKLKLEEPKPMTTTEDKPIEKQPAKKRPATCKQCGKPCTFNESGLCRPCSAARNARKAREAKPLSEPAKSTQESRPEQKPEPQRCPKCTKKLTKNGFCYTCAAHEREEKKGKARKKPICNEPAPKVTQAKSNVTLAPKTGAPKTLPNLPASYLCKKYQIQNCHDCDDLACNDNMRKPAADTIHAAKMPIPEEFAESKYSSDNISSRMAILPISILELQRLAYANAVDKGWHATPMTDGELICLMHSELSEALEELRNNRQPNEIYSSIDNKPEGVPIELADCVIRIMDFCGRHGIDLQSAITTKMAYNQTRPHRHGGKKL